MTRGIIYIYTSPSGKSYVGQTVNESNRKSHHKCMAESDSDFAFYRALRKHGLSNFKYRVLYEVWSNKKKVVEQLNKVEVFFISLYDTFTNGYNETSGGLGRVGRPLTKAARASIAAKQKRHYEKNKDNFHLKAWYYKKNENTQEKHRYFGIESHKHPAAKIILEITTGRTFSCLLYLADEMNVKPITAWKWLNGIGSRKRDFIYLKKGVVVRNEALLRLQRIRIFLINKDKAETLNKKQIAATGKTSPKKGTVGRNWCMRVINTYTGEIYGSINELAKHLNKNPKTVKDWVYGRGSRKHEFEYVRAA